MSMTGWPHRPPHCLCPSPFSVLSPPLEAVGFSLLGPAGLTVHSVLGGRFKKEIVVDGQSYLLLIRDEGGPPELQVRLPPSPGPLRVVLRERGMAFAGDQVRLVILLGPP